MNRPRKPIVPEWPQALQMSQSVEETGPTLTLEQVRAALPKDMPHHSAVALPPSPVNVPAFFYGLLKDGRHLAAEMAVQGLSVVDMLPLCASRYPEQASDVWETLAFVRLCHQREYTATEEAANQRQGGGVRLEDVAEGHTVALVQRGGKTVALTMEVEGGTVLEPKVLCTSNRLSAWQEAHAYAERWFLPRRRRRT